MSVEEQNKERNENKARPLWVLKIIQRSLSYTVSILSFFPGYFACLGWGVCCTCRVTCTWQISPVQHDAWMAQEAETWSFQRIIGIPLPTKGVSAPGQKNVWDLKCKMGIRVFGIRLHWMLVELCYSCVLLSVTFIIAFFNSVRLC